MKKFVIKFLLFVVIFMVYDKLFIIVANRSAESEVDKRLEYLVNGEINKDIVITGSSRGSRDIIASQIEKETGLSTYNLCFPGSNVEFHKFVLETLFKFNTLPKMVVLVVDDDQEFIFDPAVDFRKDRLYPLVKYKYFRKELEKHENKNKFFSSFLILPRLNKYNFDLRQKRFTAIDTMFECGSMPVSWKPEVWNWEYKSGERIFSIENEIEDYVNSFKEIISLCNSKSINLVLVFPPNYQSHSLTFENRIKELSKDNVNFYVYNLENPIYRDEEYFYDESHLIKKGAEIFTDELILYLKDIKQKNEL